MTGLAIVMVVQNEADLIERNLRWHLGLGVDHIYITDDHSTDGTLELVSPERWGGRTSASFAPPGLFRQATWASQMAREAARDGWEWVCHLDADEFLWPESDLPRMLGDMPDEVEAIKVHRHDFLPGDPPSLRLGGERQIGGYPLQPKLIHRARSDTTISHGGHVLDAPAGLVLDNGAVEILHHAYRDVAALKRRADAVSRLDPETASGAASQWRWLASYRKHTPLEVLWADIAHLPGISDSRLADALRSV